MVLCRASLCTVRCKKKTMTIPTYTHFHISVSVFICMFSLVQSYQRLLLLIWGMLDGSPKNVHYYYLSWHGSECYKGSKDECLVQVAYLMVGMVITICSIAIISFFCHTILNFLARKIGKRSQISKMRV